MQHEKSLGFQCETNAQSVRKKNAPFPTVTQQVFTHAPDGFHFDNNLGMNSRITRSKCRNHLRESDTILEGGFGGFPFRF